MARSNQPPSRILRPEDRFPPADKQARKGLSDLEKQLPELVRDIMGVALVQGTNIIITVDDPGDTITIAASVSGATLADGDYGDIIASGSGSVLTIDAGVVTLAKQANMATASVVYRKSAGAGPPEVQTLATLKTDLGLTGTNSGDQTSIVGITGTKVQFNTACTDGDFLYVGDITQYTDENAQDAIGGILTDTTTINFTYDDAGNLITADVIAGSIGPTQLEDTAVAPGSYTNTDLTVDTDGRITAASNGSGGGSYTDEQAQDAVGGILTDTTTIDFTYDDVGNAITADVKDGSITLAKQANMATASIIYRKTAGAGVPEVNSLATLKTDLGLTGTNSGDQTSIVGITGSLAEFNAALTGADFATGGGTATGTNTGDQTSIVGITGTKAQFDTACSDGNFLYVGDVTSYTDEQAQDAVGNILTDTGLAVVTYSDATPSIDVNVPAAVASDLNTGTDTSKAVTSDALAGSNFGKAVVTIAVSDPNGSAIATGDGKAYYRVPSTMNGMNLVGAAASLITASSSGIPTIQLANVTDAVDMLSTKLTIDASETDSSTAATAVVVDGAHDDVATADMLRIDIDVAGTGAKGLLVELQFQLP